MLKKQQSSIYHARKKGGVREAEKFLACKSGNYGYQRKDLIWRGIQKTSSMKNT
jgi:hypothetical protein